jgi:hypothetical protein
VIYVCGNAATMAPAVRRAFMDVFRKQAGTPAAEAEVWLAGLRAQRARVDKGFAGVGGAVRCRSAGSWVGRSRNLRSRSPATH